MRIRFGVSRGTRFALFITQALGAAKNCPSEDLRMTRLTVALLAWIGLASAASASLTPPKETTPFDREVPQVQSAKLAAGPAGQAAKKGTGSEFVVTDRTEVLVNGKPCRYEEVPANASVVNLELGVDGKTLLKIHFRTQK
jgi:hypothetical protein